MYIEYYVVSFFFQAEDGIRDYKVTGVQTCALPISALLAISDLVDSTRYDELVVDTAPVGHTLRLFQMPEYFMRFLDFLDVAGSRDQVDRKSTRLNSSHLVISYAVFCLKEKTMRQAI